MMMTTTNTTFNIFRRYLREYLKADKQRQGEILDHVCDTTGITRKAAIRRFRREQFREPTGEGERRGRRQYYTPDSIAALRDIWEVSSELCGELLWPVVNEYMVDMRQQGRWRHSDEATNKLLEMSERTIKRHIPKFRKQKYGKGGSSTVPSELKDLVPIFVGPWRDKPTGCSQIDTVAHSGGSLRGDMVYTVCNTEVCTAWVTLVAQWNKGQRATRESMETIYSRMPVEWREAHPDTGGEFLNHTVIPWCQEKRIALSRSRPYYKNDNSYVEQKNDHVVRRFMGYGRIDIPEAAPVMNELYEILELFVNHFVPTRKCIRKVWDGRRYRPRYDRARTPYQRMLERPKEEVTEEQKKRLREQHRRLSPLQLKDRIDTLGSKVARIVKEQQRQNINGDLGNT
jgi:hypothetical protein